MKSIVIVFMLSFSFNALAQDTVSASEKRAESAVEKFKAAMEERKAKQAKQ